MSCFVSIFRSDPWLRAQVSTILPLAAVSGFQANAGLKFHTLIECIRTNKFLIHTHSCDLDTTCSNGEVCFVLFFCIAGLWCTYTLHQKWLFRKTSIHQWVFFHHIKIAYNIHIRINYEVQLSGHKRYHHGLLETWNSHKHSILFWPMYHIWLNVWFPLVDCTGIYGANLMQDKNKYWNVMRWLYAVALLYHHIKKSNMILFCSYRDDSKMWRCIY